MKNSAKSITFQRYISLLKAEQIKQAEGERLFFKLSRCKDDLIRELNNQLQHRSAITTSSEVAGDLNADIQTNGYRLAMLKDALIKESSEYIDHLAEQEWSERNSKSQYRSVELTASVLV